jgi:tRNA-dihydrouridine synthase 2
MTFASVLSWFRRTMTTAKVARRSPSPATSEARASKRRKLDYPPLTPDDYRNGVMLAPMVRSGACMYLLVHW